MTTIQDITNKVNGKHDFTHKLTGSGSNKRYIVSIKNVLTSKNPSLDPDVIIKVKEAIESKNFDSLGGWKDQKTQIYYLDLNLHFNNLTTAKLVAATNKEIAIYDTVKNNTINI